MTANIHQYGFIVLTRLPVDFVGDPLPESKIPNDPRVLFHVDGFESARGSDAPCGGTSVRTSTGNHTVEEDLDTVMNKVMEASSATALCAAPADIGIGTVTMPLTRYDRIVRSFD